MAGKRSIANDIASLANARKVAEIAKEDERMGELLRAMPTDAATQPHNIRLVRQLANMMQQLDDAQADVAARGMILGSGKQNPSFQAQATLVSAIGNLWTKLSLKPAAPARALQRTAALERTAHQVATGGAKPILAAAVAISKGRAK